jgi:deoxyribonuclease IV
MKFGLKLWSTNDFYIDEAVRLYEQKVYDYIELFVVPGSLNYLPLWQKLNIPFILHAPHSYVGLNPSNLKFKIQNLKLLNQVEDYRKLLNPKYIIFHPGIEGQLSETIRQFNLFKERYPELFSTALIENKPAVGLNGEICVGCSPDDILTIQHEAGMEFCYDVGHSIYYANNTKQSWNRVFKEFLNINPNMFHLSDGDINASKDMHLNFGKGDFDLKWIINNLPIRAQVSIETEKNDLLHLDDFKQDINYLKELYN